MIKSFFTAFALCLVSFQTAAFEPSDAFNAKTADCAPFKEERPFEIFGMKGRVKNEVKGEKDGVCLIVSTSDTDLGQNVIECSLKNEDRRRLKEALAEGGAERTVTLPLYGEILGEKKQVGTHEFTGTAAQIFWNQAFNDPNICRSEFKEEDMKKEFADALEKCVPTEKKFGAFGINIMIKFAPSSKRAGFCDLLQKASFPSVSATVNGVTKETPAVAKETRCRLSTDKMRELAERLRSNNEENGNEENNFIPKEWTDTPELCAYRETETPSQTDFSIPFAVY